jgi:hypothetical protein
MASALKARFIPAQSSEQINGEWVDLKRAFSAGQQSNQKTWGVSPG